MNATAAPPFGTLPPSPRLRALQRVLTDRRLSAPMRAALRRRTRWLMPRRPADVTVEGIRLRCAPADNKVDFDILAKARLDEPVERAFLLARLRPGDVFVDVGANIGVYTLTALLGGPPGVSAVAFEPHPVLRERLCFNLAANRVADRARIVAAAVGPAAATTTLWANSSTNAGRSSLLPFAGDRSRGVEVEVCPLAALLGRGGIERVDAVKIDVEGFEDDALMPFFDSAPPAAWPHTVVIETLHRRAWRRDCLAELAALGYAEADGTDENALLVRVDARAGRPS